MKAYFKVDEVHDDKKIFPYYHNKDGEDVSFSEMTLDYEDFGLLDSMKDEPAEVIESDVILDFLDILEACPIETYEGVDYYVFDGYPLFTAEALATYAYLSVYLEEAKALAKEIESSKLEDLIPNINKASRLVRKKTVYKWHPFIKNGELIPKEDALKLRHQDWYDDDIFNIALKIKGPFPEGYQRLLNFKRPNGYLRALRPVPGMELGYFLIGYRLS